MAILDCAGFWTLTAALSVIFATLILLWAYKRRFIQHRFLQQFGIKGPKPDLIFGNYLQLKKDRVKVMSKWIEEYGDYFGLYYGGDPVIVLSDVDVIRQVFVKESASFINRPDPATNEEPFSSSILFLKDEQWKTVRAVLTPSFSAVKMKLMTGIMKECTKTFVDIIKEKAAKAETFDMNHIAQGLTLDIICKCALAMDADCQRNEGGLKQSAAEFFQQAENAFVDLATALPCFKPVLGFLYRTFGTGGIIKDILDNLTHVIKARRKGEVPQQPDILQLMLDAQAVTGKMNDRQLMANAFTFLVAGYETSATAITFIAQIFAEKPELQDKIMEEVDRLFPGKKDLSYEDLHALKYLDQVINECLRFYPPVILFVARKCIRDTTVQGYFFPSGCNVIAPVYQIHHDPRLWDSPEEFRPERFEAGAERPIHPAQFLPFGLGPRMCVGMRFSMLEIKMALVELFKEVRLRPGDGFQSPPELVVPTVIINPKNGIQVKAELL